MCAGIEVGFVSISSEDKWVSVLYLLHSLLPPSTTYHEAFVVQLTIRYPTTLMHRVIPRHILLAKGEEISEEHWGDITVENIQKTQ